MMSDFSPRSTVSARLFRGVTCVALAAAMWSGLGFSVAEVLAADATGGSQPKWLWAHSGNVADNEQVAVRKQITLDGSAVKSAKIYVAADDSAEVFLNDQPVFQLEGWNRFSSKELTAQLKSLPAGKPFSLSILGKNGSSAAGIAAQLIVETEKQKLVIVTDESWSSLLSPAAEWQKTASNAPGWKPATVLAELGGGPWTSVTAKTLASADRVARLLASPADRLKTLPGFSVELVYSVPMDQQGSWVSLCVDPKGRLIVCDQYGGLFRVTPGAGEVATVVEPIAIELGEAQGLLWAFDSLYVVVNGSGKFQSGLYRVTDSDGDDQLDTVTQLRGINGGGEHGPHAVLPTPDGKNLVVVCGNSTQLVETVDSRVPRHWGEDHLLPRMADGRGFMKGVLAPGGCIYQVTPDGKDWTLLSMGFRNQYDAAFNRHGDLFSYDADMEWDMSMPWYRPTRVCHVVSGSDWGWRNGAGKYPPFYVDTVPPAVNVGPGSPTGIVFGYGAKFPAKYQEALFICDWSYGKLYATHLKSNGSSYGGELEEFVTGTPLPLTDVVVRPQDGALYFTVGGRKTTSGLYRVTYVGQAETLTAPAALSAESKLRRQLEAAHAPNHPEIIATAVTSLGHSDRFVRHAARIALEHQPLESWQDKVLAAQTASGLINGILAIVRTTADCPFHRKPGAAEADPALRAKLIRTLAGLNWSKLSLEQQFELTRVYHVLLNRLGPVADADRQLILDQLNPVFPTGTVTLNGEVCQVLIALNEPTAVPRTMKLLAAAATQEEEIEFGRALRVATVGWTEELRTQFFTWLAKAYSYTGGNSFSGFLDQIKNDAAERLPETEQTRLAELIASAVVKPRPALTEQRPLVQKWTMDDLEPKLADGLKGRNFERGRQMFATANCYSCHRFNSEGGALGPDLSGVAGRFSPRDLLESIIVPSKTISDQYGAVIITLLDGRSVTGRIVNLSNESLILNTDMLNPNAMASVNRSEIEELIPSPVSMMPNGLLDTLQPDEALDLLAYLLSRGDRKHAVFQP